MGHVRVRRSRRFLWRNGKLIRSGEMRENLELMNSGTQRLGIRAYSLSPQASRLNLPLACIGSAGTHARPCPLLLEVAT